MVSPKSILDLIQARSLVGQERWDEKAPPLKHTRPLTRLIMFMVGVCGGQCLWGSAGGGAHQISLLVHQKSAQRVNKKTDTIFDKSFLKINLINPNDRHHHRPEKKRGPHLTLALTV